MQAANHAALMSQLRKLSSLASHLQHSAATGV